MLISWILLFLFFLNFFYSKVCLQILGILFEKQQLGTNQVSIIWDYDPQEEIFFYFYFFAVQSRHMEVRLNFQETTPLLPKHAAVLFHFTKLILGKSGGSQVNGTMQILLNQWSPQLHLPSGNHTENILEALGQQQSYTSIIPSAPNRCIAILVLINECSRQSPFKPLQRQEFHPRSHDSYFTFSEIWLQWLLVSPRLFLTQLAPQLVEVAYAYSTHGSRLSNIRVPFLANS